MINQDWAILLVIIVLFLIFSRQGQSALDNLLSTLCPLVYLLASGFYYLLSKKIIQQILMFLNFKKKEAESQKFHFQTQQSISLNLQINKLNFHTYPHNRHFHQDTYNISQLFHCLINFNFIFLLSRIKRCSLSFCCLFQNFIK